MIKTTLLLFLFLIVCSYSKAQINSSIKTEKHSKIINQAGLIEADIDIYDDVKTPLNFKYRLKRQQNLITSFHTADLPKPGNYNYLTNPYGVTSVTINTKSKVIGKIKLPFNYLF